MTSINWPPKRDLLRFNLSTIKQRYRALSQRAGKIRLLHNQEARIRGLDSLARTQQLKSAVCTIPPPDCASFASSNVSRLWFDPRLLDSHQTYHVLFGGGFCSSGVEACRRLSQNDPAYQVLYHNAKCILLKDQPSLSRHLTDGADGLSLGIRPSPSTHEMCTHFYHAVCAVVHLDLQLQVPFPFLVLSIRC